MTIARRTFVVMIALACIAAAEAPPRIALQPGLTIVTALTDREGDYESIKTVEAVTPDAVKLAYSADIPPAADSGGGKARKVSTRRTVKRDDLRSAHEYMQLFSPSAPEIIAGTTAIGTSAAVLAELKTKGQSSFTFQTPGRQPAMDKVLAALTGGAQQAKSLDDLGKQLDASKASGTLTRVEAAPIPFPILVNGQRTTLPAIHARGTFDEIHAEFYFLDDPDNPIALKWTTGSPTGALQVVQITYPAVQPAPQIERSLKDSGRAEVHGIYFDFGSATIKPESEPALKEIAEAVARNPTWAESDVDGQRRGTYRQRRRRRGQHGSVEAPRRSGETGADLPLSRQRGEADDSRIRRDEAEGAEYDRRGSCEKSAGRARATVISAAAAAAVPNNGARRSASRRACAGTPGSPTLCS